MGERTQELIAVLDKIIEILDADKETHWRSWMADCRGRLRSADYSGVTKLLGAYGGMGSFNDLVLNQNMVGRNVSSMKDSNNSNEILAELRSKAYDIAKWIARNHDIAPA